MKRRSPLGFVEALARRLARRARQSTADLPYRYVFVVAYARSGSTLLQKILASIDGFHVTGENADALAGLFFSYQSACQARQEQGAEPRTDPGDPWRGADRIDPEQYAKTLGQAFVDEILQPPARARMIGFKEVRYFDRLDVFDAYLDFIRLTFAPALLVLNRRDPAAVAASGWWRNYPRESLIAEIERFDTLAAAYAARHPDATITLDYDAYGRDVTALRPLFDRLGVPFDAATAQRILDVRLGH
jgi:hypothetical protein